ncbi:hypothetical protein [Cognatiyoonia sp. IB215182]|uniref:hypothetical protein n=1 Tax=Cognatiyoonia sp. IB215182 TaxID=3097353 RepID=UPI002A0D137A|nr:hypothetical protein [Cognatiyoonia sp. IB215182]MDX8353435.1 hypothetical protein [Cognatiyoonia sp. IB215182]
MRQKPTERYCADAQALTALKRDGMGWGHDLECGCFEAPATPRRPSVIVRVNEWLRKGF